jgi:hypothetical protein
MYDLLLSINALPTNPTMMSTMYQLLNAEPRPKSNTPAMTLAAKPHNDCR